MSGSALPAWSGAFAADRLGQVRPLRGSVPLTREAAWGAGSGSGVRVAVIDSGVDGDHPRVRGVAGAVVVEIDDRAPGGFTFVEGPHEDLYGHGTACAGIIRALAPECEIYSVRVLGASLQGRSSVFAAGLRWAIEQRMDVINLSLSTKNRASREGFYELMDEAVFHDIMVVSAANNVLAPSFPSLFSSVFSVAAYEGRDPEHWVVNPEPPVEFGAPGIDVEVAWSDGGIIEATGNSFAAPHIAGMAARIVGHHPGVTVAEVKAALRALADNTDLLS